MTPLVTARRPSGSLHRCTACGMVYDLKAPRKHRYRCPFCDKWQMQQEAATEGKNISSGNILPCVKPKVNTKKR